MISGKRRFLKGFYTNLARYPHMNEKSSEMHPLMGSDILNNISKEINNDVISSLEVAETIIPHHHEKWDGTGYPHRLKGEEIPLEA
ncbi:HD domain-containing phosphohydrolase [Peribacillus frigoritolerans]|uniref:HD domain-containing phosphohydrolase n=1 Tax=Peribacillus frigoritolerans TaxID=450367 RepID=UPI0039A3EF98